MVRSNGFTDSIYLKANTMMSMSRLPGVACHVVCSLMLSSQGIKNLKYQKI